MNSKHAGTYRSVPQERHGQMTQNQRREGNPKECLETILEETDTWILKVLKRQKGPGCSTQSEQG